MKQNLAQAEIHLCRNSMYKLTDSCLVFNSISVSTYLADLLTSNTYFCMNQMP